MSPRRTGLMPRRSDSGETWRLEWARPLRLAEIDAVTAALADDDITIRSMDTYSLLLDQEYAVGRRALSLIKLVTGLTVVMTEVRE